MKKFAQGSIVLMVLAALVLTAPLGRLTSQAAPPPPGSPVASPWARLFLPQVMADRGSFQVSGKVTDAAGSPIAGVTIVDGVGSAVTTDAAGVYTFSGLRGGPNTLAAFAPGYNFSAPVELDLKAATSGIDFTAESAGADIAPDGSFESGTGWVLNAADLPARLVTSGGHSGSNMLLAGILADADNAQAYATARSTAVTIPPNAHRATLKFWLFPMTSEVISPPASGRATGLDFARAPLSPETRDFQFVNLIAKDGQQTLISFLSNQGQWAPFSFDLSAYAGQSVQIEIGVFNDGIGGITSLYADDIALTVNTDAIITQPEIQPTTPPGTYSENLVVNSGFEDNGSWNIPNTDVPAGYSGFAWTGVRSMRTGISDVARQGNRAGWSEFYQELWVPALRENRDAIYLDAYIYPQLGVTALMPEPLPQDVVLGEYFDKVALEAAASPDFQYVLVEDLSHGGKLIYDWSESNNNRAWEPVLHIPLPVKYFTESIKIRIVFGTYNDGRAGAASMFVDDVTLTTYLDGQTATPPPVTETTVPTLIPTITPVTPGVTATPGLTPTPGGTLTCAREAVENGNFERKTAWQTPYTAYSAGYSQLKAASGDQSMRTGIFYSNQNTYSYSEFYQRVTVPTLSAGESAILRFNFYPKTTQSNLLFRPQLAEGLMAATDTLAGDVSYAYILDKWMYNWRDTLLLQRSNERQWMQLTLDVSSYAGETINLLFGTYNDGYGGVTSMHVDDVSLSACR
jgi:hypothetical protein